MGNYLNQPNTNKEIIDGECTFLKFGIARMQGWKKFNEDQFLFDIDELESTYIFGIFDGHSGDEVAKFLKIKFTYYLKKNINYINGNIDLALRETFLLIDKILISVPGQKLLKDIKNQNQDSNAGSTVIVVLIKNNKIISACAGDSKAILYSNNKILSMYVNHDTTNQKEIQRIKENGGYIENNRVWGKINITRSIGDFDFKKNTTSPLTNQIITSYPDIIIKDLEYTDNFLILGSDGVWEYLSPKKICEYVKTNIKKLELSKICSDILDTTLAPSTDLKYGKDNMTIIIIKFK